MHQRIITTFRLYTDNISHHLFVYTFDIFCRYANSRHVKVSNVLFIFIAPFLISSIPVLYHTPIILSTVFKSSFVSPIYLPDPAHLFLSFHVASPLDIT